MDQISYELRVYESVDDSSQKSIENRIIQAVNGN